MAPARWQRIKSILADALEEEDASARAALLARSCQGDPALLREVESLLNRQAAGLERFATGMGSLLGQDSGASANLGRRVGAYELTRELGRGGMGAVYLGRRTDGRFEQQVAIKLLKRGTDTEDVLRRFRGERRILARLQHPNIARLLDGGETEDGLPFFVMEYVDGVPLTTFARERTPSIDARLELFGRVCAAVQFAHQNLVVHRDLKPGNILVTAAGEPKLLDFGLARLLGPADGDTGALEITVAEARRLTPAYASPEQVRGAALTTGSDVYSLGALLYELLTGEPPHRFNSPHPSPVELLRVVGEQEPVRASLSVTHAPTRALLRGDLDNVIALAMRKEPARRYPSVGALAEDVRRHRENRPVRARPDTLRYRTAKFVARNRLGVAVGCLVFLALAGAGGMAVWQARQARQEAALAQRRFNDVRALAHTFLFDFHDSIRNLPGSTSARRLLVTSALGYIQRLEKESGNDVDLRRELARAYLKVGDVQGEPNTANLGDTPGAQTSYRRAVHLAEELPGNGDATVALRADAWTALGNLLANTGNSTEEAGDLIRRGLAAREILAVAHPRDATRRHDLGVSLMFAGDLAVARENDGLGRAEGRRVAQKFFERAREVLERLHAENIADHQNSLSLARVYYRLGNGCYVDGMAAHDDPALLRSALDYHRRSLALREELVAAEPGNGQARRNLADGLTMKADLQTRLGEAREALTDCQRGIELFKALAAADQDNFWARQDLAYAYYCISSPHDALGDLAAAGDDLEQSASLYSSLAAADPGNLLPVEHLSGILRIRTRLAERRGEYGTVRRVARRWAESAERLLAAAPQDEASRADLQQAHRSLEAAERQAQVPTACNSP